MEKEIQVPEFMGKAAPRARRGGGNVPLPLILKAFVMLAMATIGMVLVHQGNSLGLVVYAKEVVEFVAFIVYFRRCKCQ